MVKVHLFSLCVASRERETKTTQSIHLGLILLICQTTINMNVLKKKQSVADHRKILILFNQVAGIKTNCQSSHLTFGSKQSCISHLFHSFEIVEIENSNRWQLFPNSWKSHVTIVSKCDL